MKTAWVLFSWFWLGTFYGGSVAFAYLVGNVRGARRASKNLRRKLMIAGSRFAGGDE
jgi:hypothetical protein